MEQELRMLLKRPGNEVCADCGARYPRFASITLAIFLCNRCYGIHRSVGAHITRTKTVGLDRWSIDEIHRMSSIGNAVGNAYWEENVPSGYIRPTADSPDFVAEKWIRDKYERKLFCPPDREPPSAAPRTSETPSPPAASNRSGSPQVKLLPRGALRCGPNCTVAKVSDESCSSSTSGDTTTKEPLISQKRSSQSSANATREPPQPLPLSSNPHPIMGIAVATASEEIAVPDDDDDEFGDFVQA